jgi:DDE superfamily endonuclease
MARDVARFNREKVLGTQRRRNWHRVCHRRLPRSSPRRRRVDLLTGKVHALVKDRHRRREFIEFLKLLEAAYPAHTGIKLIIDNHSAHISKETKAWLANHPTHRFQFTFTPKHGSWLNLVEGFFSKLARSVLRHIRVASKQELKDRIMAAMDHFNQDPVVHACAYKIDKAA